MTPVIRKMIEAYYPGEDPEELEYNEPDMRQVLKVVLDDMREFERNANGGLGWPISVSEFLDDYKKDRN